MRGEGEMNQKSTPGNRKVKLAFMDCAVQLEGTDQDLNGQALGLLSVLVADRLKFQELSSELGIDEEEGKKQRKSKKVQFDSMFS